MDSKNIDILIEGLEPDYKDLVFGDFFEQTSKIFFSDLKVPSSKIEEVSYLLTLYFILVINKYQLITEIAEELSLSVRETSGAVFRMLDNLPPNLISSIESAYREGVNDSEDLNHLDKLHSLSREDLELFLEKNVDLKKPRLTKSLGSLNIDIAEAEKTLESLQSIRTMSGDMRALRPQEEITYTASSQADILKPPPIAPSNTPANSPRWDTEA